MKRQNLHKACAKFSGAALAVLGMGIPAYATNLLINPGFEFPTEPPNTTEVTGPAGPWTPYGDTARYSEFNHTPGGTYGVFMKVFEVTPGGWYQDFSNGVQPGGSYTFSGWYYFEQNFSTTNAVVDVELSFLNNGSDLEDDTYTYIAANSGAASALGITPQFTNPDTGQWIQYSVTGTAPPSTNTVEVSFDWQSSSAVSGPSLSAFADDGDLEGPGTPPTIPAWNVDGSGDWNNANNWSTNLVPGGVGSEADFLGKITANHNVYTDTPVTVGTLLFNNTHTYVIDGAGSLTLQAGSGNAGITVQAGTQEINLPLTVASNAVFTVASGTTLVIGDPMTVNPGLTVTQSGTGTVKYESTITGLSGPSAAALNVGKTDTLIGLVNGSQSSIVSALQSGYAGGAWNGNGINSSAASFAAGTSVGYDVSGSQVEVRYTWIGDLNLDGVVNAADATAMGTAGGGWQHGDLNYDGVVNADDYALFAYGLAKAGSQNINSVPEPAALGLLAAAGLLARRRRA